MNKKKLLGERLREIRKKFGYTQEKMSEIVGVEPQSISKIESGKNFPLLTNLEKIADNFNLELKDFFDFEHKNSSDTIRKEVLKTFDGLSKENQEKLLRIAKILEL